MKLAGLAVAVTAALLCAGRATARPDPNKLPPTRVQDLHYGDVLFYFFQGDDFEAITRLNAYDHWGLMPHHTAESQLLLGGLYLSLGLHNEAGVRFEKLLTPDVPVGVRNRAWFYLAQVWYARGYLDRTEQALRQVQGKLPAQLEAQRTHLLANVLLRQGRFDEAVQLLKDWRGSPDWVAYAQFNLGVALVREGKVDEADAILASVGELGTAQPEMLALRDRANLALGFAYLQANKPDKALPILQRVRLNGPYSNKALLGVGWAQAALGDYKGALVPWLALRGRNLLDAAVQESYLAVPYAYAKLNANAQAADNYEDALRSFALEGQNLDESVQRIRDGKMLDALLTGDQDTRYGWFWQLQSLPAAPESRYLYPLLADHDFQEGLKNFRDLGYMGHTLERWSDSMEAFSDMIDTREHAYAQRLPRVDALLSSGAADKLQHERDDLETRLNVIEHAKDVAAIGSPEERAQWERIRADRGGLVPGSERRREQCLARAAATRQGRTVFSLERCVQGARVAGAAHPQGSGSGAARGAEPLGPRRTCPPQRPTVNTGEFAARLAALKARIAALQARLAAWSRSSTSYLQQIAVAELAAQKDRLDDLRSAGALCACLHVRRAANAPKPAPANPPRAEEQPAAPSDAPANSEPPPSPNHPDPKP